MKIKIFFLLFFLLSINIFSFKEIYRIKEDKNLKAYFFYVGQGDATFFTTPLGYNVLIDGGPDNTILEKISKLIPTYNKTIDLIILTHPHSDHLRGLIEVINNYDVKLIVWTGVLEKSNDFDRWIDIIKKERNVFTVKAGTRIHLGDTFLDIIYPFDFLEKEDIKDLNNTSIAVKLNYYNNSFLFTGDLNKNIEKKLVDLKKYCKIDLLDNKELCDIIDLDSNIFKVGHHGSKTSTLKDFLYSVSPDIAIISSGIDNIHNHPHNETLETLNDLNIKTLRTDKEGDILIRGNGELLFFKNNKI